MERALPTFNVDLQGVTFTFRLPNLIEAGRLMRAFYQEAALRPQAANSMEAYLVEVSSSVDQVANFLRVLLIAPDTVRTDTNEHLLEDLSMVGIQSEADLSTLFNPVFARLSNLYSKLAKVTQVTQDFLGPTTATTS